ncbi:hypothetical protein NC653_039928 [Populus alba x Populus x berolinensis]|uniref:Uncharacterized protein n=1 Tax=Populus alba x Populus x berolinensis TaxID=444605 RepID=A0AAD6PR71_9ROSI|nr:hypothetical protein NC653_039928 [Populus alba x Populus x berolinensis]
MLVYGSSYSSFQTMEHYGVCCMFSFILYLLVQLHMFLHYVQITTPLNSDHAASFACFISIISTKL